MTDHALHLFITHRTVWLNSLTHANETFDTDVALRTFVFVDWHSVIQRQVSSSPVDAVAADRGAIHAHDLGSVSSSSSEEPASLIPPGDHLVWMVAQLIQNLTKR